MVITIERDTLTAYLLRKKVIGLVAMMMRNHSPSIGISSISFEYGLPVQEDLRNKQHDYVISGLCGIVIAPSTVLRREEFFP